MLCPTHESSPEPPQLLVQLNLFARIDGEWGQAGRPADMVLRTRGDRAAYVYRSHIPAEYKIPPALLAQLGPPDRTRANPYRPSGPRARLYLRRRVEEYIAAHEREIAAAREAYERRRAAALRAPQTCQTPRTGGSTVEAWAESCRIVVRTLPPSWRQDAARHYTTLPLNWGAYVAFVRHQYTNYESLLYKLGILDRERASDGYQIIKSRVNDAVTEAITNWDVAQGAH